MAKCYDVDIFDEAGDHLATVTVYGATESAIDRKLAALPDALKKLDSLIDSGDAFAELEDVEDSEIPETEDWEEEDGDEDEEDAEACAVEEA